ncbi:type II toxin-antitoxin system VapC family toxin [Actinomycetaceae bacterium MB13-C1-2]|nr:type II toxin-antitoxin system VapC family toxin [Actinomycetaceae bacterium MB13-C1-2]
MIILDTNVVSEVIRPNPDARVAQWLESLAGEVAITSVSLGELLAGVELLPNGRRKYSLSALINSVVEPYRTGDHILPFDDIAAKQYGLVLAARERAGSPISTADAQIAAICRVFHATCATRNTKDFEETGVQLINPWQSQ